MKVLHVTNAVGWSGGMEQISLLIRELKKKGHENYLACPPGSELLNRLSDIDLKHRIIPMFQDYDAVAAWNLRRYVQEIQPDIVHTHHATAHAVTLLGLTFTSKPPLIVSRRVSFSPRKNPFSRWKYRSSRITRYTVVSEAVKETLIRGGVDASKIRVIYSSVDPVKFAARAPDAALKAELNIPADFKVIGKVANVAKWKGQHVLLQAAKVCLAKNPKLMFVFAGKDTDQLKNQIQELGIAENVRLAGFRKDIPRVLSIFDLSINSAIEGEGLSGAMRESLMMEIPVLASDVAGNREIVKHGVTGRIVPPNDPEKMAQGILEILTDLPAAKRLAQAGRRWVLDHATLEIMVQSHLELYQSLL